MNRLGWAETGTPVAPDYPGQTNGMKPEENVGARVLDALDNEGWPGSKGIFWSRIEPGLRQTEHLSPSQPIRQHQSTSGQERQAADQGTRIDLGRCLERRECGGIARTGSHHQAQPAGPSPCAPDRTGQGSKSVPFHAQPFLRKGKVCRPAGRTTLSSPTLGRTIHEAGTRPCARTNHGHRRSNRLNP
jgi:hypothetical protein